MEKAFIELWGITFSEPVTFLSDAVLAAFAFIFYFKLKTQSAPGILTKHFSFFFFFLSTSTFLGGISHLVGNYVSHNYLHVSAWSIMALGLYHYETAMAQGLSEKWRKIIGMVSISKIILFIVVSVAYQSFGPEPIVSNMVGVKGFFITTINLAITFIGIVFPIAFRNFYYGNRTGDGLLMLSIILLSSTLLVRKSQFSISQHFNYNEISHIILLGVFYIFYLGMRKKIIETQEVNPA